MQPKNWQNFWNFLFSLLFVVLVALAGYLTYQTQGALPTSLPLFDFVLLVLATFRLTRLFVYDKITQWFRDWFLHKKEIITGPGIILIERAQYPDGPRRTISDLLACPWCIGVWFALLLSFLYFLSPLAWYFLLILAVSGAATFTQLLSNWVGWQAEYKKLEVQKLENKKEDHPEGDL